MHQPVLLKEVLEYLNPQPDENFVDCTLGLAGHSSAILENNQPGKVLGIDLDKDSLEKVKEEKIERLIPVQGNFANLKEIVERNDFYPVNGILLDLGFSSWQLEKGQRGISFQKDEILDMRFDKENDLTAKEIVNQWPEKELEKIFQEYGQERFSRKIAREIVSQRKFEKIETTSDLVEIVSQAIPFKKGKIHFATRIFQALRIAVNDELNNLRKVLPQALEILESNGRLIVISFHSLEDRIVKNFFREKSKLEILKILTKKPIRPGEEEIRLNPRSRSAKLRAITKL